MQRNPGRPTEAVANGIVHGHVGGKARSVVNVGSFAVGRVGSAHVVVVAAEDHRPQVAPADGLVEGPRDGDAAHAVGVENAGLRADHEAVLLGLLDPAQVVFHLKANVVGCFGGQGAQHVGGDSVGGAQVVGGAAGTDPAERAKTVVEAHRSEDVLHVARVGEVEAVFGDDVGSGAAGFEQKCVSVVKKVHASGVQRIDGGDVAAQRGLNLGAEALRVLSHEAVGFVVAVALGVVASGPRVVQRSLVRTQVDVDVAGDHSLPKIHGVSDKGDRSVALHGLRGQCEVNGLVGRVG